MSHDSSFPRKDSHDELEEVRGERNRVSIAACKHPQDRGLAEPVPTRRPQPHHKLAPRFAKVISHRVLSRDN